MTVAPLAVGVGLTITLAVSETELFVAVPLETYPALTTGVTLTVLVKVRVFVPVETVAEVPEIVVGADAEPFATALIT